MKSIFPFYNYVSWFLLGTVAVTGIFTNELAVVNAAPVNTSSSCQTADSSLKANDFQRQVTVRFEIKGKTKTEYGSGVIIRKKENTPTSFTYTVLTVDHNFVSDGWGYYNIFEPKYPPLVNLDKPQPATKPIPEEWQDAKVTLITCDTERHQLEAKNLTRLRRNFGKDKERGVDLALVTFESDKEYEFARLTPLFQQELYSKVGVLGWPKKDDKEDGESVETYNQGKIQNLGVFDYLGAKGVNGYVLYYNAKSRPGMSGGPVFDTNNLVVGINGKKNSQYNVGITQPNVIGCFAPEQELIDELARGIPTHTLIDQLELVKPKPRQGVPPFLIVRQSQIRLNPDIYLGLSEDMKYSKLFSFGDVKPSEQGDDIKEYIDGIFLLVSRKYSESIKAFTSAIENAEKNKVQQAKAYYARSFAYSCNPIKTERSYDKALEDFAKVTDLFNNFKKEDKENNTKLRKINIMSKAAVLAAQNKYEEAFNELSNEQLKENAQAYILKGQLILQQAIIKKYSYQEAKIKAENAWKIAEIKIKKDEIDEKLKNYLHLGNAQYLYNDKNAAIKSWKAALKIIEKTTEEDDIAFFAISLVRLTSQSDEEMLKERLKPNKSESKALKVYEQVLRAIDEAKLNTFSSDGIPGNLQAIVRQPIYDDRVADALNKFVEQDSNQEMEKKNPNVYMSRAYFFVYKGKINEALEDLKKAKEIYTGHKDDLNKERVRMQICKLSPQEADCPPLAPSPTSQPPTTVSVAPAQTFICDPKTSQLTLRTTNGEQRPLINWQSLAFTPSGYNPQIRCQQVSARLEKFQKEGRLNPENITSSVRTYKFKKDGRWISYPLNVLCLASSPSDAAASKCTDDGLIITLERSQKAKHMLQEFRKALSENFISKPLIKGVDKPKLKDVPKNHNERF